MRTLDELLEVARNAEREYKATKEQASKEYQQELDLVDQAKALAQAAIAAGDEESYTKAQHDEQYHKQRANELYKHVVGPFYTPEEHNALVAEINEATASEKREQFKRLYEIRQEVNRIARNIDNINGRSNAAGYALGASGVPTGMAGANYHFVINQGVPASINRFLKDGMVDYDIGVWYKPSKEAKPNE